MERLALIGVSQRRGGTEALETWTAWAQNYLRGGHSQFPEIVPITTCNRCDLVVALPDDLSVEEARKALAPEGARGYAYTDEAALEQLCRVAASLDSLNPGEDQIMNQVRQAFEEARQTGTVGPTTGFAFQTALRIAKRVRREVALAPANASLFSLARPEFEQQLPARAAVAVVGIGEMGSVAARNLAARKDTQLLLVNRSLEKAQVLAEELGAQAMSLEAFLNQSPQVQGLVTATPVEHLLESSFLKRQLELRVIADLGLPRNVRPSAVPEAVVLIDLKRMQSLGEIRREQLRGNLAQAERLVQEEVEVALGEWAERQMGPAIAHLRERYRESLEEALGELLEPSEVNRLANRFAHLPVKGLRGLARRHGLGVAQAFLEEAGLDDTALPSEEASHV
ncbi:MAG: glutamyl-tRNA reductase [Thermaceae bacterium]|nr:glutamyl-tRNA reductase [Thermaceae bacterium]